MIQSIVVKVLVLACCCVGNSGAFVVTPRAFSKASTTAIYGDGNPPPFGDWGAQPATTPPVAPAPASWGPPPPSSATVAPPPAAADAWAPTFASTTPQAAPAPSPPATTPATTSSSGSDPIATLDASQQQSVESIAAAIPELAIKSDCCWNAGDETIAGQSATLDARDAPGPGNNVAWLASVAIPTKLSSLTIFCGPLTDVPQLLSRVALVNDDTLHFNLDFRPRAYGAYEMRDDAGNYPGPETLGRKAFEYSGARSDFDNKFGTEEVKAFMESTLNSFEGATVDASPVSELELLTRGPLCLSVTMPNTDANIAAIANARAQAVEYWIEWAKDPSHEHRPGAPINSQFVYDQKYRQNAYGALLPIYTELFGTEEGAKLAAAESGPIDEAYVGGGS